MYTGFYNFKKIDTMSFRYSIMFLVNDRDNLNTIHLIMYMRIMEYY